MGSLLNPPRLIYGVSQKSVLAGFRGTHCTLSGLFLKRGEGEILLILRLIRYNSEAIFDPHHSQYD